MNLGPPRQSARLVNKLTMRGKPAGMLRRLATGHTRQFA